MTGEEFIKGLLCLVAERERENGVNGMLGIMFMIRNRVNAGWCGGDWLKVLDDRPEQVVHFPDVRDPSFQRVLQEADGVYDGSTADTLTNGALYCGSLSRPYLGHERVAQIGTLTFWK